MCNSKWLGVNKYPKIRTKMKLSKSFKSEKISMKLTALLFNMFWFFQVVPRRFIRSSQLPLMLTGFGIYTYTCQTNFPTCPANAQYLALINWSLHLQFCAEVSWELLIDLLGLFLNQKWNYVKTHYRHFWKNEFLQLVLNYCYGKL